LHSSTGRWPDNLQEGAAIDPVSSTSNTVTFGRWLKQLRKEYGYTQDELAQQVGCSVVTIRRIEDGTRRPSRQLAELLAARLEIPPGEIASFLQSARTDALKPTHPLPSQAAAPLHLVPLGEAGLPNPYKGLRAYREVDAPDFFGREALTARLLARLSDRDPLVRFLAVVGPSGSGKSSVVRAGLIPALRRSGVPVPGLVPGVPEPPGAPRPAPLMVAELVPGSHVMEELEAALLRVAVNPPASLIEQLQADERGLARAVKRVLPADDDSELLLVIDQFEEIFTLVPDEHVRSLFLKSLYAAITGPRSRLWVIVTLRADFYDRPLLYEVTCELMRQRTELVTPLTPEELHHVIVGPAQRAGVAVDPDLVATIQSDVTEQPGMLPLLQYALTELFEHREAGLMTLAAYRAGGGVTGAISRRAEAIYAALDPAEQQETRQLFLRLVSLGEGAEDTRRRVRRTELASAARDEEALDRVLDVFGRYRLLTFDRDSVTRGPTVEVAHEALIKSWSRLREWLDAGRADLRVQRQLMSAAGDWAAAEQDPSFLASGARLAQFHALEEGVDQPEGIALTAEERAYLQASASEQEAHDRLERERRDHELALQKRAASRLRVLVAGLATFLMVAAALAAFAFAQQAEADIQRRQAQNSAILERYSAATAVANEAQANAQREQAQANFTRAEAQRLAAEANRLLQARGNAEVIALLSVRSMTTRYSTQGDAALAAATLLSYPSRIFTTGHDDLRRVAFSPDGKMAVTCGWDNTARLWDMETGAQVRRFDGHTAAVWSVAFSPDGRYLLTGSGRGDQTARLWDVATGSEVRRFSGHTASVLAVVFSPDGTYALTGGGDATVRLWDVRTGDQLRMYAGHTGPVRTVAFSAGGEMVLTASEDQTARLWDAASGEQLRTYWGHTSAVWAARFSPDGVHIVTAGADDTLRLWVAQTGAEVRQFTGHTGGVMDVAFAPDGKTLLSGGFDATARVWDVQTGAELRRLTGHDAWIWGVAYSPDGRYALTGADDDSARLWDLQLMDGLPVFRGHVGLVQALAYTPDGAHVLTGGQDHTVRLWDALTGEPVQTFKGHTDTVGGVAVSPDGRYVLTSSEDKTARLWDAQSGLELSRFSRPIYPMSKVAFSPDPRFALASGANGDEGTWMLEAGTGREIRHFAGGSGPIAISPDGKYLLLGTEEGSARLWEVATAAPLRQFGDAARVVNAVAFAPNGKFVITGSTDNIVQSWDVRTGTEIRRFIGHNSLITSVAMSPDGRYVLTASADGTARLWDASTGAALRVLAGHGASVNQAAFSPDGRYLLTAGDDGTARLWHVDYHDVISYLCSRLQRDFSNDEREQYSIGDKARTCPDS
jgi:WD40 repeat protein/transcriptional regulator with XRE-family HTH domain